LQPYFKAMQDILFSRKQYQAVVTRLDEMKDDVTSIKLKSNKEKEYLDNFDLMQLLHVSYRTVQRWRRSGNLPYRKIGKKFYYKADYVMDLCKLGPEPWVEIEQPPPTDTAIENGDQEITCKRCPLFLMLNL